MSKGNESAFPTPLERSDYGELIQNATYGLSKREYAAIQIAAGICANSVPGSHHVPSNVVRDAVELADALLERLSHG